MFLDIFGPSFAEFKKCQEVIFRSRRVVQNLFGLVMMCIDPLTHDAH